LPRVQKEDEHEDKLELMLQIKMSLRFLSDEEELLKERSYAMNRYKAILTKGLHFNLFF
jgi:hypothetical protein